MIFSILPMAGGAAADSVPYLDANGEEQECTAYTTVTDSMTAWSSGWYVVDGPVSLGNVTVNGPVNLILADGCNLTAASGIKVKGDNSLTIYAQSGGPSVSIAAEKTEYYPNETVKVTVSITDAAEQSAEIKVGFDSTLLTLSEDDSTLPASGVTCFAGNEDGSVLLSEQTVIPGNKATAPEDTAYPAKTGYKAAGWKVNGEGDAITSATVNAEEVTANVNYYAAYALDVAIEQAPEYVAGYVRVKVTGVLAGYTFGGNAMYLVEANTFAFIYAPGDYADVCAGMFNTDGYLTGAGVLSLLAAADSAEDELDLTPNTIPYNVNGSTKFDIADVRAVYNCQKLEKFAVSDYMDIYLLADVKQDNVVDSEDVSAIIDALLKKN